MLRSSRKNFYSHFVIFEILDYLHISPIEFSGVNVPQTGMVFAAQNHMMTAQGPHQQSCVDMELV